MSRLVGRPAHVTCNEEGAPISFRIGGERLTVPVRERVAHWREWIGVLDGEPERDIWRVDTPRGVCELHRLRHPREDEDEAKGGRWLLFSWED